MSRRNRTSLCREGWYYLMVMGFVIAGAILREINLLLMMAGMMLGPLLFNGFMARGGLRPLKVRRKAPESVTADEWLVVEIEAERPRRFLDFLRPASWAVVVRDPIRRIDESRKAAPCYGETMFWRVPKGQTVVQSYRGRLLQRGIYELGPLTVFSRFPLGLVRSSKLVPQKNLIYVYPRIGRVSRHWSHAYSATQVGSSRSRHQQGLLEGDFHSLRDWRAGDSKSWIHWRTTARRGALTVRQFEQQRNPDLAIVVDPWAPPDADADAQEAVEHALSLAASIVADLCRRGNMQLYLNTAVAESEPVQGNASVGLMHSMLRKLAMTKNSRGNFLPGRLVTALDQTSPGTKILVVSTRDLDLSDTERFADIWNHPHSRAVMENIVGIDVRHGISDYLEFD